MCLKTAFCTFCSAAKVDGSDPIPAIERYKSNRIAAVHAASINVGADFYIFSGQFGLLKPEDPIAFYDHLMVDDDVKDMVRQVAGQLEGIIAATGLQVLIFFSHRLIDDPLLEPYQRCLREAGEMAQCTVIIASLPKAICD